MITSFTEGIILIPYIYLCITVAISATKKFFVTDGPIPPNLGIANINQAGYDPTDRDRLAIHYNPAAGKINLNAQNDMYGRSNIMGGNYTFDPAGDYLNAGGWDGSHTNPIHPLGSGLDNALSPATGAGGALFGNNLRVGIPRVSAGNSSAAGSIQCPYGFYQYNNVCVPGVNLDPTNPANTLGINVGNASYQEAKGVILQVIPPVKTSKGQLFQVVTQIQNIGHKAGKFYTLVSVGSIGLTEVQSNSIFLDSGQKGVVYQSLQMPAAVPDQSLLVVKSDLYKQALDNPTAPPQIQDSNQANLPNPDTTLGMPPPRPPIPNFPLSKVPNNTQGFGFPFNPPQPGPQFPRPPPPPGFSGPFSPFGGNQFGIPFTSGFSARADYGEVDMWGNPIVMPSQNYGYPIGYPPVQQQPSYNPANYNYQQYQYTGDPNYNPTPPPYPIYGDASSPIQTNPYYGNYQYPYQYPQPYGGQGGGYGYQPPMPQYYAQPQYPYFQEPGGLVFGDGSNITETDPVPLDNLGIPGLNTGGTTASPLGNIQDFINQTLQNAGISPDAIDTGAVAGAVAADAVDEDGNTNTQNLGDSIRKKVNEQLRHAGVKHGNRTHNHSSKRHKHNHHAESNFTSPLEFDHRFDHDDRFEHDRGDGRFGFPFDNDRFFHHQTQQQQPTINISPHSSDHTYAPGQRISISVRGFSPGEVVVLQMYIIRSFLGTWRFTQKIGNTYIRVGGNGKTSAKSLALPNSSGKTLAIVAIGMYSGQKIHTKITIL